MKFSVITPVFLHDEARKDGFIRCVNSLATQTCQDFEHIVIDDGSPIPVEAEMIRKNEYTLIRKPGRMERVLALQEGFAVATGEWFCLLDSDDIYLPHYLEAVSKMIEENPDAKMFNFGSIHIGKDGFARTRDPFKPAVLEVGHEVFGGGNIVNGTFVWHRSVWEDLGDFDGDKLWNPWDFSIEFQKRFPETSKYFMVPNEELGIKVAKELGNPWGQDFALFYRYTRKYHSLPFNKHLYGVYGK